MKQYVVSAEFKMGKQPSKLTKEITAENEERARDKLLCILGSKHRTPRRFINILNVAQSSKVSVVDNSGEEE